MQRKTVSPRNLTERKERNVMRRPIDYMDKEEREKEKETNEEESILEEVHPLQNKWTFWYYQNQKGCQWIDNLLTVKTVSTVEEFWQVYLAVFPASEIPYGSSFFFFKHGLKPMWEDEGNRKGGRWLLSFDRRDRNLLTFKWLEVLLCLIGESCGEDGEDICGAVVDVRPKFDKISIWTRFCGNKDKILTIGKLIKSRIHTYCGELVPMTYESHEDTQQRGSRSKYTLTL